MSKYIKTKKDDIDTTCIDLGLDMNINLVNVKRALV